MLRANQRWRTDFTDLKVIGWGWLYLSTILDDYSRYIIGWKLCGNMRAEDVADALDIASLNEGVAPSGCDSAKGSHKTRLLSDNGSSCIAGDLAEYLEGRGMKQVRGTPMHPQTQGKIEPWHQTLINRILLEDHFFEADFEAAIDFLTPIGQIPDENRQEYILLSDVLGVSMMVGAINKRRPGRATETPSSVQANLTACRSIRWWPASRIHSWKGMPTCNRMPFSESNDH